MATDSGWIKVSRGITRHWVWDRPLYLKWWLDLVMMASWEEEKRLINGRLCTIGRGQMAASIDFLRERWEYRHEGGRCQGKITKPARKTISKFIGLLQSERMIERDTKTLPNHIPLITICNYDSYQSNMDSLETTNNTTTAPTTAPTTGTTTGTGKGTTTGTTTGTATGTSSGTTSAPQLKNIRIKEYNNTLSLRGEDEENFKNKKESEPSWEEVRKYFHELGTTEKIAREEEAAKYFYNHFSANGWKGTNGREITDWRARARIWVQDWNEREKTKKNNGNNERKAGGGDSRRGVAASVASEEEWAKSF